MKCLFVSHPQVVTRPFSDNNQLYSKTCGGRIHSVFQFVITRNVFSPKSFQSICSVHYILSPFSEENHFNNDFVNVIYGFFKCIEGMWQFL